MEMNVLFPEAMWGKHAQGGGSARCRMNGREDLPWLSEWRGVNVYVYLLITINCQNIISVE